ncbi:unnamed protein product [Symbiodinium microadriaticum]|nr:unnamed protein product [Symbiodinium microadriaticum]
MCRLSFGYDCWKWVRVNELCHKIIKLDVDLYTAEKELQVPGLAEVECFVSPFLLTCLSYLISTYVLPGGECEYAQLFGGVVWLLPGLTIVIALLEIYSKMIVYGSARLVFGVSMASQMGFGIVMACALCYPNLNIPESFTAGCVSPFPWQLKIPFMLVAAVGGAVILNVAPLHFPGVLLVSGCGQTVGYLVEHYIRPTAASTFRDNVAPVLAAVAVTAVARLVGRRHYHMYLIAGLLLLVPGGIGVKGMSSMWSGDMESGIVFTFKMIMVGISLAIGVFMALLPKMRWLQSCMECMSGRGGRKSVKGRYFPIGESKDERMKMLSSAKPGSREGEGVALRTSSAGGTTTWK